VIVEERFSVAAPPERVWEFFLDVPRAAACMPGVERVEAVDERTYRGQIQVRIGPMRANFTMDVTIEELRPPAAMRLSARGTDRGTSSLVEAKSSVGILPGEGDRSEVALAIDVAIRGPLGRFGQVVIRDTVRKMTEQFLACAERSIATGS